MEKVAFDKGKTILYYETMDPETVPSTPLITPKPPLPKKLIILGILISLAITLFSLYYFKIIKLKTSPTSAPPPLPPSQASQDLSQNAKKDLPNYLNGSLKTTPPVSLEIQPTKNSKGVISDNQRLTGSWNGTDGEFYSTSIRYSPDSAIEDENILIVLPKTLALTVSTAPTLLARYIKTAPAGSWKCAQMQNSTICENFWQDSNQVKHGIGAMSSLPDTQKGAIFTCDIYPQSPSYAWKSCSFSKSQTGI